MSFGSWTHWTKQSAAFPDRPIVVRRRVLTIVSIAFLVLWAVWIFATLPVPVSQDGLTRDTWWIVLATGVGLGVLYLYTSSTLVIRRDELEANNPLWAVRVPNEALVDVRPGWHLQLVTSQRSHAAWAVEARNLEMAAGNYSGQMDLESFLRRHSVRGDRQSPSSAVTRVRLPGMVFWIGIAPSVYAAIVIAGRT